MTQLFIALFGLGSIYCAMGHNQTLRRWAPIMGLAGQPAWAWFAWQSGGWGLGLLVLCYTLVYLNGIRVHWIKSAARCSNERTVAYTQRIDIDKSYCECKI